MLIIYIYNLYIYIYNLGCYSTQFTGLGSAGTGLGLAETLTPGGTLSPGVEEWEVSHSPWSSQVCGLRLK